MSEETMEINAIEISDELFAAIVAFAEYLREKDDSDGDQQPI